mmetsp:Transcript_67933/g.133264  ORF Transcript_67933/g.133264 Transcript_67933/m.133264 type:complete len:207 (+) Transcript_67933:193-813(+)
MRCRLLTQRLFLLREQQPQPLLRVHPLPVRKRHLLPQLSQGGHVHCLSQGPSCTSSLGVHSSGSGRGGVGRAADDLAQGVGGSALVVGARGSLLQGAGQALLVGAGLEQRLPRECLRFQRVALPPQTRRQLFLQPHHARRQRLPTDAPLADLVCFQTRLQPLLLLLLLLTPFNACRRRRRKKSAPPSLISLSHATNTAVAVTLVGL